MPQKKPNPVGRCIYCLKMAPDVILTDEHIVPEGLGCDLVLPMASCTKCATITSQPEGVCLRGMFRDARAYFQTYGKQRKPTRPTEFDVAFSGPGDIEIVKVPINEYPFFMAMPLFDAPGCLIGKTESEPYPNMHESGRLWLYQAPSAMERGQKLFRKYGKEHKHFVSVGARPPEVHEFCRMLAKIAHSLTVLEYGSLDFDALLPDFILGKTGAPNGSYFVGCAFLENGARIESIALGKHDLVELRTYSTVFKGQLDNREVVYVRIQLFAALGAPVYEVVSAVI